MDEVRCRPDISIAALKTLVKEKLKPDLDQWSTARMTLRFNGTILEPDGTVAGIDAELRDENGKRVAVQVETHQ